RAPARPAPVVARTVRPARQAGPPRRADPGRLQGCRDPGQGRGRLRPRLRRALPEPAIHRRAEARGVRGAHVRFGLVVLIVVASALAGARPASTASLPALPTTVRVNIAGLGTSYAVIASTGTVSAIGPDGTLLYRGTGKTLARTNVRSVASLGVELPSHDANAGALS